MNKSVFTEKYTRFRRLLIEIRQSSKLTQVQVAQRLHKPQSFVSKYERGERRLDVVEFLEVAKALEVNPSELLTQLDRPTVEQGSTNLGEF
ncbi:MULTISPECIES: helix-turn-helix domain-containing protein [Oscillatoriales]|uniref:Helix-turn-helix domain-containing protein n=1 Tax=Laspinema olomoucense D3b TaxID=2953688 RepID=A0ABT2NBV3_9CYAN|nr:MULTISPECIES: helix-turn-helix transcriptional regulator [Oscillatoriales]MCT7971496.1 helix-turn-helix domain-containing protein [Laspinema sp. D3d]MCT7980173.1 helix-turn-helix domain-containing protein [Laspinema sp. D3b]MCT7987366.1 helix-turn-helix domain-containing protein [Laspinema sp. D3a]MCT7992071.1 helix-turn-helix domain-containing protein [Laspinema sp. D3c]